MASAGSMPFGHRLQGRLRQVAEMWPAEQGWLVGSARWQRSFPRASRGHTCLTSHLAVFLLSWRSIQSRRPCASGIAPFSAEGRLCRVLGHAGAVSPISPEGVAQASADTGGLPFGKGQACRRASSRLFRMGREARPILPPCLPAVAALLQQVPRLRVAILRVLVSHDVPAAPTVGEERLPLAP